MNLNLKVLGAIALMAVVAYAWLNLTGVIGRSPTAPHPAGVSLTTSPPGVSTTSYSTNSSQSTYTCPPYSNVTFNSATFSLCSIPKSFSLGQLEVDFVYNGTGYITSSNGTATMFPGYGMIFNLTFRNITAVATFAWAPPCGTNAGLPCFRGVALPSPNSLSLFGGDVHMRWYVEGHSLYLTVWIGS
jgi:hypothetical protein